MFFEYFALTRHIDPTLAWVNWREDFTAGAGFPSDMFREILSRVDVKQLCTFKLLNKEINSLIPSKQFKLKHFEHMQELNNVVFLFQEEAVFAPLYYHVDSVESASNGSLISPEDREIEVLASAGGMIVFCDSGDDFFLYNPITNVKYTLDTCKIVFPEGCTIAKVFFGMGFVTSEDDYKVVRVSVFNSVDVQNEVMVYSRNTGEWTRAADFLGECPTCQAGVEIFGKLHWRSSKSSTNFCITSFDLCNGTYDKFSTPDVPVLIGFQQLVALDAQTLALAPCKTHADSTHPIWILENYFDDQSWTKVDIDFGDLVEAKLSTVHPLRYIKPGRTSILFRINPAGTFVIYDMRTKKFMNVGAKEVSSGYVVPFHFYPTLHSPLPLQN